MAIFNDVEFAWKGHLYTLPSNKVMRAIAEVENIIALNELQDLLGRGAVPLAKLACAYATVLRMIGVKVEDEEVYSGMFDAATQETVTASITTLMLMMIPKSALAKLGAKTEGNSGAPANRGA
jgi:hypothetical protein